MTAVTISMNKLAALPVALPYLKYFGRAAFIGFVFVTCLYLPIL
jgi:hypothetical protein